MCLCLAEGLCCAGAACCACLCAPCEKAGVQKKNYSKIGFVVLQLSWVIVAIIMLYTAKALVNILPHFLQCPEESGGGSACMGVSAIIRMSFTLMVFHALVFIVCLARNDMAAIFHDGCWLFKNMMIFCFFIGMLFVRNEFFRGYASFARYVSIIFLFYQAILILIVAYKVNSRLVSNFDNDEREGSSCSAIILIGVTAVITILNVIFIIYQYIWFHGCAYNDVFITIALVAAIIFYGLIFLRTREDASILTSSIVVAYILYMNYAALASNPADCNPVEQSSANTLMQILIGLFFTFVSLLAISTSVKRTGSGNVAE